MIVRPNPSEWKLALIEHIACTPAGDLSVAGLPEAAREKLAFGPGGPTEETLQACRLMLVITLTSRALFDFDVTPEAMDSVLAHVLWQTTYPTWPSNGLGRFLSAWVEAHQLMLPPTTAASLVLVALRVRGTARAPITRQAPHLPEEA